MSKTRKRGTCERCLAQRKLPERVTRGARARQVALDSSEALCPEPRVLFYHMFLSIFQLSFKHRKTKKEIL